MASQNKLIKETALLILNFVTNAFGKEQIDIIDSYVFRLLAELLIQLNRLQNHRSSGGSRTTALSRIFSDQGGFQVRLKKCSSEMKKP